MDNIILELRDVNFSATNESILTNINLKIVKDTFVAIIGRSGSGKSTLLKIMAGLQVPDSGNVIINNCDITDFGYEEMIPVRKKIGYAFQDAALISNLSIKENLMLGLDFHFPKLTRWDKERMVRKILDRMMILHTFDSRPAELSLGEKKIISIARSMVIEPEILFLDEPFAFIDISISKMIKNIIKEYSDKESTTVICVTNSRVLINELADHIMIIDNGNITLNSSKESIMNTDKDERPQLINDILG
ncbi:MAG TPA: ATP-binding cassette domain-containing protein [Spirochaetota bacterium]|nr:ATP-binding cassette domain-containing protein [Spirochaetota bacterium]